MEGPSTKTLQDQPIRLLKYLILCFSETFAPGLPRGKQAWERAATGLGASGLSEQSPGRRRGQGGGEVEMQGDRNQLKHSMLVLTRSISCRKL